jgi:hypothetical protein
MTEYKIPNTAKKIRDVSRKLYGENIITLNEMQNYFLRRDIKTTHKELISKSIEFSSENKNKFLELFKNKKKDNTKENIEKWLSMPKVDLGNNWMEEIDTLAMDYNNKKIKLKKKKI